MARSIEAGAAALYSGDAATAVGLFDLAYPNDEEIATEAAYQEAIGGQLDLDCTEPGTSGDAFDCIYRYGNSLTDAIGFVDSGETFKVRVSDGQIVSASVSPSTTRRSYRWGRSSPWRGRTTATKSACTRVRSPHFAPRSNWRTSRRGRIGTNAR